MDQNNSGRPLEFNKSLCEPLSFKEHKPVAYNIKKKVATENDFSSIEMTRNNKEITYHGINDIDHLKGRPVIILTISGFFIVSRLKHQETFIIF